MTLAAKLQRLRFDRSRRSSRSIGARILQVVVSLAGPWILGFAIFAICVYQNERNHITNSTIATSRALASAVNRELASTMLAAQVLASSPFLASDDFAAFHREATKIAPMLHASAILLADATGQQLVNTLRPSGEALPLRRNIQNLRKVFETGQPSVSDLFLGSLTNQPSIVVEVPVLRDGHVKYTIGIALVTDRLGDLLTGQQLPPDWVSTIADSSGAIVARAGYAGPVGTQALPVRLSAMTAARSGLVETSRHDGTRIFVGFSKSDMSDWTVAISVPVSIAFHDLNLLLRFGLVGLIAALIIGFALAFYQSAQIARAVQSLIPQALAIGHGEVPAGPRLGVREVDEVAQALDRADRLVKTRTAERDSAAQKEEEAKTLTGVMSEFVNNVSHELRTPLTSIAASLGLLAGGSLHPLPSPTDRLVSIAHANAQRLVRLVNDILDIARLESGKAIFHYASIELLASVKQAIDANGAIVQAQGLSIRLDARSPFCIVRADDDRLVQALTNLLSNAIKFSPPGGEIVVTVERAERMGRVTVRDQGPGIPDEFRARIFGKFAQAETGDARRKGGSGLGLNIVQQIVTQHAGAVTFDNAPGGGAIFCLDIPLVDEATGELVARRRDSAA
ncbi:sensor histidine kinase [Bradyrhizobium sp.]|uniref:sensor histidine kinase n=1 Tax=Bradyrhizobium sp. TaxID=376 RepID=UPI003C3AB1F7